MSIETIKSLMLKARKDRWPYSLFREQCVINSQTISAFEFGVKGLYGKRPMDKPIRETTFLVEGDDEEWPTVLCEVKN